MASQSSTVGTSIVMSSVTVLSYRFAVAVASELTPGIRVRGGRTGHRWLLSAVVPGWETHMHPPVDPWGAPEDPFADGYIAAQPSASTPPVAPRLRADTPRYGRASVPVPPAPLREPTAELPTLTPRREAGRSGR